MVKVLHSIKGHLPFSFYQNIEYFTNNKSGSLVYINSKKYYFKERTLGIANFITSKHLTSLNSYYSNVSKVLGFKYNQPLVLSNQIILIRNKGFREYDNIWINYAKVKLVKEDNKSLIINFKSGNKLIIKEGIKTLLKQIENIKIVKTYLLTLNTLD